MQQETLVVFYFVLVFEYLMSKLKKRRQYYYLNFLIIGIFRTAIKAIELGRLFEGLIAFGAGVLIAVQALFNIGVNLGILPTKGLTLPFISYGGTSLILFMFMIGMVLRINHDNRSIK